MSTQSKDFKVKNGLIVGSGGTFGGPVVVGTPTLDTHAATKAYVDANAGGGQGVPTGGTTGQILAKIDGTNYNTEWIDNYTTDLEVYIKNSTGSTLTKGQVVYISGATGANALISLSKADAESTSSKTLGFLKQDLTTGSSGYVIRAGIISGIDTSLYSEGAAVWLSPTTAGGWTTTKPTAPNHMVYLGVITRSHATVGEIQVSVQNGYELEELHNVAISSLADGNLLTYEASTSLWKNKTASQAGVALATHTHAQSDITNLTTDLAAKAPLDSPTFTGTPSAPTAVAGTNTTQVATTAFVATSVANLVASAPSALDTLNELALALGSDPNFATTVTNSLAGKQPLDADLTAIAGLTGTSGLLKKTAADTWELDTNSYLTISSASSTYEPVITAGTTSQYWRGDKSWQTLATVATTGAYSDLSGKPSLATVATTGAYSDLTGSPSLATVATTGAYSDLTGKPSLATVATSGSYADLTGKPTLDSFLTVTSKATNDIIQWNGTAWVNKTIAGAGLQPAGSYLTSESDTLASVTGRGATTSTAISITAGTSSTNTTTGSLVITGGIGVSENLNVGGNIVVTGNLTINGTTTTVNTTDLAVKDSLVYLATGNTSTDSIDIGILGAYGATGEKHSGFVRKAGGGWKLFSGLSTEPTSSTIDLTGASYDSLTAGSFIKNGGTSSQFLKADGSTDSSTYLTGNQSITFTGDATGSGTTSVALTLANTAVTAGTYKSVTVDAKGRVTGGTNPTTLSGYGITDAMSATMGFNTLSASASIAISDSTSSYVNALQNITYSTGAVTVTVNDSTYPVGTQMHFLRNTTQSVTFASGTATVYASPGYTLRAQYSMATLIKVTDGSGSGDVWILTGDIA